MTFRGLAPDFSGSVAAFVAGHIGSAQLTQAFGLETVYTLRPSGRPAVMTLVGDDDREYLPAWSSLTSMASQMAGVAWLAGTGADLLAVMPPDVGLMIDPGADPCLVVPPSALGLGVTIEVLGQ